MTSSYYDDEGNFVIDSEFGHKIVISHHLFERYSNKNIDINIPLSYTARLGFNQDAADYDITGIKGYGAEYCD